MHQSFSPLVHFTLCWTCLLLCVQSCQEKQSSWLYDESLAVSWNIDVTLILVELKIKLYVCFCIVSDIPAMGGSGCVGLNTACGCHLLFFLVFPFLIGWRSLSLSAFQAENPLTWTHCPGTSQLPINLSQLWQQKRQCWKWDIKSIRDRRRMRVGYY